MTALHTQVELEQRRTAAAVKEKRDAMDAVVATQRREQVAAARIRELEHESVTIKTDMAAAQSQIRQSGTSATSLQAQVETLRTDIRAAQVREKSDADTILSLRTELAQTTHALRTCETTRVQLEQELGVVLPYRDRYETVASDKVALDRCVALNDATIHTLKQRVTELTSSLDDISTAHDVLCDEKRVWQKSLSTSQQEQQEQMTRLQTELATMREDFGNTEKAVSHMCMWM